jgi:FMN phosphatase YigB (HAD superfamily)
VIPNLEWTRFKAVLFDVDGTLYDQRQLRKIMAVELGLFALTHPWRLKEVKILSTFRRLREENFEREETSLLEAQYRWTAEALGVEVSLVRKVADEWLLQRPLRHLRVCRPGGLAELFKRARRKGIKIGVFSDYPAEEKLKALGLRADAVGCALDRNINRLKPNPAGLRHLCEQLGVSPCDVLHVGDREDRDAVCAERCGCASIVLSAHEAKKLGATRSYDLIFP